VRAGALKGLLDLQTATSKTTDAAITIADGAAAPLLADAPFLHSALLSLVDKEGEHFKVQATAAVFYSSRLCAHSQSFVSAAIMTVYIKII
jgi:hypothetical protein